LDEKQERRGAEMQRRKGLKESAVVPQGLLDQVDPADYAILFEEKVWRGPTRVAFQLGLPPVQEIAVVGMLPYVGDEWLLVRHGDGWWPGAGGKLEPGESYLEAIRREVREETGAQIVHYAVIGAYRCLSLTKGPLKPHLPWPWFYQVIGFGEVEVVDRPNPTHRERILDMVTLPLELACQRLRTNAYAGAENVEVLRLAAKLRRAMEM
jgi:8-oxo-dGTP pyrophosphatase MutT (NUDIX family)